MPSLLASTDNGGPLAIQHVSYVEGRGNLIITYQGSHPSKVLSLVGCHMDVVTANPDDWVRTTMGGRRECENLNPPLVAVSVPGVACQWADLCSLCE